MVNLNIIEMVALLLTLKLDKKILYLMTVLSLLIRGRL